MYHIKYEYVSAYKNNIHKQIYRGLHELYFTRKIQINKQKFINL